MSDVDNLDTLSNAELRAQMIAQGLPNIPVTDSSRKVLVKRLRASLGGNPVASSPKKNQRRETLQPAAVVAATAGSNVTVQLEKLDGATVGKSTRRTIAATPSNSNKESERRTRAEINVPVKATPVVAVAPKATPVVAAAPKTTPVVATAPKPTPAVATAPKALATVDTTTKSRAYKNTLEVNSLIILESDEEEDEQLEKAARNAEAQYTQKQKHKVAPPQLSATATSTHAYISSQPLYPTLEPSTLDSRSSGRYGSTLPPTSTMTSYRSAAQPPTSTVPAYRTSTVLPSTLASTSTVSSYRSSAVPTTSTAASYRRSPPRTYTQEFSDDNVEEEGDGGDKYESDFARNLARLRAERIGDRSSTNRNSPFSRRTIATGSISSTSYEPIARRSLRPQQQFGPSEAFQRWCQSLDKKYNLKSKLFLLFVLLLIYLVYKFYY